MEGGRGGHDEEWREGVGADMDMVRLWSVLHEVLRISSDLVRAECN